MQGGSAKEMQLSQSGTLVLQKSGEVSQQVQQRANVTSFSSLDVSVVQAFQGCCFSEGPLGSAKAACAWYLLVLPLGMRGRGRLWESSGGCLTLHARTSRTSA